MYGTHWHHLELPALTGVQEHVQQWYPALESYRFALDLATRFAGKGSELTMRMQKDSEVRWAKRGVDAQDLHTPDHVHQHRTSC